MPERKNLTNDVTVRNLKWKEGERIQVWYKDKDHQGFYLCIGRGGSKTFYYRYKFDGKPKRLAIGRYPAVSCKDAYAEYLEVRDEVHAHKRDPASKSPSLTLNRLFDHHYLPDYAKPNKRSWKEDVGRYNNHVRKPLGELQADSITKDQVSAVINGIDRKGTHTAARHVLSLLNKIYNWSNQSNSGADGALLDDINPCRNVRCAEPKSKAREEHLNTEQIRTLLLSLTDSPADRALKFQLLTGCRASEAAGLRESELDRKANEWILPADRVDDPESNNKSKRPLVLPLTDQMLEVIGEPVEGVIFPSPRKSASGHVSTEAMRNALKHHGLPSRTHTMRKTFITGLARLNVPKEIRDRITNHADPSVDGMHYNMHDYMEEKRDALQKWGDELMKIVDVTY